MVGQDLSNAGTIKNRQNFKFFDPPFARRVILQWLEKGKFMQQHSYWISKIGKVNQKTKENLIYNLYIFLLFPVSPNNSVAWACTGIISKLRHLAFSFFALMH